MNKAILPAPRAEMEVPRRVIVKFADDVPLPYVDGVEKYFGRVNDTLMRDWNQLITEIPGLKIGRVFNKIRAGRLAQLVAQAKKQDPTYRPPNFFSYFAIELPDLKVGARVVSRLSEWSDKNRERKLVQTAYIDPAGGEPTVGVPVLPDDPQAGQQFHLAYAPIGIDARYAWQFKGGDGENQTLVDFERGWNPAHTDLPTANISVVAGVNSPGEDVRNHGNSVLGIICATDNAQRCLGISPNLQAVRLASYAGTANRANILLTAIENLSFGSVLLIEASVLKNGRLHPIEAYNLEYEAIRLATALGIVVVEAAANGWISLDAALAQDSLAILVGAGRAPLDAATKLAARNYLHPTTDPMTTLPPSTPLTYERVSSSNRGQRVKCFAWGEQVTTLTNTTLTTGFQETSAAAAIVAGTAVAVQGIVEAAFGRRLDSVQMRALLEANGTAAPAADIGVMPNLRQIIDDVLQLSPDDEGAPSNNNFLQVLSQSQITPPFEVYIRDDESDTGLPHNTLAALSPDVRVSVNDNVLNTIFATPPATPQLPVGQAQHIYIRVWNRGVLDATNVPVKIYQANAATLLRPTAWQLIDQRTIPVVAANNSAVITGPFMWDAHHLSAPSQEEYLIVLVGHATEPNYLPSDFKRQSLWQKFVSRNARVTLVKFQIN